MYGSRPKAPLERERRRLRLHKRNRKRNEGRVHYLFLFAQHQHVQLLTPSHVHIQLERFNFSHRLTCTFNLNVSTMLHCLTLSLCPSTSNFSRRWQIEAPHFPTARYVIQHIVCIFSQAWILPARTHQPAEVEVDSDSSHKTKKARKLIRASVKASKCPPGESTEPMIWLLLHETNTEKKSAGVGPSSTTLGE